MKKFSKAFLSSIIALTLILSSMCGSAYAATSNLISIQKYENSMKQIYAKYGIEWKIVDSSDARPITKALYTSEIKRAEKEGKDYQAKLTNSRTEFSNMKKTLIELPNDNYSLRSIMPVTSYFTMILQINCSIFANCRLLASANATYNADSDLFLSLNSSNIIKYTAVNCNAWNDGGSSIYMNSTRTSLYVHFVGTADFSYTIPGINVKVDIAVPVDGNYPWATSDGGTTVNVTW